jgi:hypothetical protein
LVEMLAMGAVGSRSKVKIAAVVHSTTARVVR